MRKFLLFGFIPIEFSADGTWKPVTGSVAKDWVAHRMARCILKCIDAIDRMTGVPVNVRMDAPTQKFKA